MTPWLQGLARLRQYPSALAGLGIIALLVAMAVYAVTAIPYSEARELWRGGEAWQDLPTNASPVWTDRLLGGNAPRTIRVATDDVVMEQERYEGVRLQRAVLPVDFPYGGFPQEINLFVESQFDERQPFVRLTWRTPDGESIPLDARRVGESERISISQDRQLESRLGFTPQVGLFTDAEPGADDPQVRQGTYELVIEAIQFEETATLDANLVVYGQVHGLFGTDHKRRDLTVALLWGTPVALAFGLLAAVGTTLTTLIIAATGVWFGGWVDAVIQRLTEINIILPLLPILVMVGTLYSTSIWLMLGVVVVLGIFSAGIKMYRSMLLPIREAPYIEAARAYGAGNARIILRYLVPRILPVLIPTFVTLIPTYVFLEASLAVLGLGDPVLPTWGKILNDAQAQSALYHGHYYWVLEPAALLMLTGLGFAMLGFALDRIFNPRLRNV